MKRPHTGKRKNTSRGIKRLLAAQVIGALMATMFVAFPEHAGAFPVTGYRHHVAWGQAYVTGLSYGPNSWTHGQKATITGFHYDGKTSTGKDIWSTVIGVSGGVSPMSGPNRHGPTRQMILKGDTAIDATTGQAVPMDWWNPLSWDWDKILGLWDGTLQRCSEGALAGIVGDLAVRSWITFWIRGLRMLEINPIEMGGLAIFGCLWSVFYPR